jgi:hypothetical protein
MTPIESLQEIYAQKLKTYSSQLNSLESKIRIISYSRLIIAIASVILFYFAIHGSHYLFFALLSLLITFSALVIIHSTLFKKKELMQNYIRINENELKYLSHDFSVFDKGQDFIDFNHPYTYDLDIFGESSLFQSICRTVTYQGRIMLSQTMSQRLLSGSGILSRQVCIKELKDKFDFRQHFQARGLLLKETSADRETLTKWLNEKYSFINQKSLPYMLVLLPLFTILTLMISVIKQEVHILFTLALILNGILYAINGKKIIRLYSLVSRKKMLLDNYSDLMRIVYSERFKSRDLEELRLSLQNGSAQITKLSDYVGWFDQRLNMIAGIVLNGLFLSDLQCCYRIEKWRSRNDKNIIAWLNTLGKADALFSLSNFAYNNPEFILPEFPEGELSMYAEELSHPLIAKSKRIPNDFDLSKGNSIAIITGANMAGKSTFLRTLGINIVLSYTGAPVCAARFKIPVIDMVSSMRVSDSLKDDVSYFYAELQKLKSIRIKIESGQPAFILLDEMLRGTNSKDKQQGSKAFMENLLNFNCLSFLATHDLSLGILEEEHPMKIKNFCFEGLIKDEELFFDYKIKNGVAQNTNASFLMKKLGII